MTSPCDLTGVYVYDTNVVVLWVPVIVNVQAPTHTEILTGTSLQPLYDLTDIIGWEAETEILKDGKWGPFEEQRMGEQAVPEARMVFAARRDGDDIRTFWDRGETGFIVILPSGPYLNHPTAPVNVYPVRVAQLTQRQSLRTYGASLILVTFAITSLIGENVTVAGP